MARTGLRCLSVSVRPRRYDFLFRTEFDGCRGKAVFFVHKKDKEKPEGDKDISGYRYIRYPMYVGGFIMFLWMPLALGSWCGLFVIVLMMPALMWRQLDEEKFLAKNLQGYSAYQDKVKYRLVLFIW